MVTRDTMSATDALNTMVTRGFRHLPVCNDEGDIVGLLDIAKVFYEALEKLERAHGSSQKLYHALEGVQNEWGTGTVGPQNAMMTYIEALREKMALPDLSSILDEGTAPCTVSVRTSVFEASKIMKQYRTTAVCVMEGAVDGYGGKIAGIFTSKDVVLRVIAAGLNPRTCSVVRVMTPHPDTAPPEMSIQSALRKMHNGHYLNLPVLEEGQLIGVVDVLRLTWKTLEQINSMADEGSSSEVNGGPMWNHFWNSFGSASFTGSIGSASQDGDSFISHETPLDYASQPEHQRVLSGGDISSDVFPNDSASAVAAAQAAAEAQGLDSITQDSTSKVEGAYEEVPPDEDDGYYTFKFTTPTKRAHRFQAPYDNVEHVREVVAIKLAGDDFFVADATKFEKRPDPRDFKLGYVDDEGDNVIITANDDLADAVRLARKLGKDRVTLHIHGGPSWAPMPASEAQTPDPSAKEIDLSPEPVPESESEEENVEPAPKRSRKASEEELIFGVLPKDLALPAAIGFLGVAVLLAVTLSRPRQN